MQRLLKYENGAMASDSSSIQDTMQAGVIFSSDEMSMGENGTGMGMMGGGNGIMGGSLALDDAIFFGFSKARDALSEVERKLILVES